MNRRKILYLDAPFENEPGGDKNRSRFIFDTLRERFEVDVVLLGRDSATPRPAWTRHRPLATFAPQPARFPRPSATPEFSAADHGSFAGILRAGNYDAVFSRFCTGWELCKIAARTVSPPAVIVDMDMVSSRLVALAWAARPSFSRRWFLFEKWKLERLERKLVQAPVLLLLSNPQEMAELNRRHHSAGSAGQSALLPNNLPPQTPVPVGVREPVILFFGSMDSAANINGFSFLMDEILPLVETDLKRHKVVIHIVGKNPPPDFCDRIARSGSDRVKLIGGVDSIAQAIADSQLVLLPLRVASGTRTRILEAAAQRRAVITTPIGAEGLDVAGTVLIGNTAAELAAHVKRLLANPGEADALGGKLSDRCQSRYAPEKVAGDLFRDVEAFIARRKGAAP